jgi:ribokinase
MDKILVIGSYNVGLTVIGDAIPKEGQTVLGDTFDKGPGGKGSNQAITIARLGGNVVFLARIGKDSFGKEALELFSNEHIDTEHIQIDPDAHTGAGIIFVDKNGHNAIGVAPGANYKLSVKDLEESAALFGQCRYLLIQLETPLPVVFHAIKKARQANMKVVLNPAPAQKLEPSIYPMLDFITPNETEAEILTGIAIKDKKDAFKAGKQLVSMGVKNVIVTLGADGCVLVSNSVEKAFLPPKVKAVDTTGAGDAFNGGFVFALAQNRDVEEAIDFASKVAAYSVLTVGVVPGLPTMEDLTRHFGKI